MEGLLFQQQRKLLQLGHDHDIVAGALELQCRIAHEEGIVAKEANLLGGSAGRPGRRRTRTVLSISD
jgi:hypothetical protein